MGYLGSGLPKAGDSGRRHGNLMAVHPLSKLCRSGKRAHTSGMWNQEWTNAASSAAHPISQVCAMQPL